MSYNRTAKQLLLCRRSKAGGTPGERTALKMGGETAFGT